MTHYDQIVFIAGIWVGYVVAAIVIHFQLLSRRRWGRQAKVTTLIDRWRGN